MTQSWPVVAGSYVVGDPAGPVAVCTLTTERLPERLAAVPGVAIAGQLYTANLGIERIILNVTANPSIRFLVVCGKDSKLFRPGQSLGSLVEDGIDGEGRIVGAQGYDPVLPEVSAGRVSAFRRQIQLVDWTGEEDPDALTEQIEGVAAQNPGPFTADAQDVARLEDRALPAASFTPIRPGGHRQPLEYDPKGYFVISIDREDEQIVLQHYLPNHTAAHEMRGRLAESMVLGLLREGLVSQLSHAGYLGAELAKAEAALHLDLHYRQDRPLQPARISAEASSTTTASAGGEAPAPRIALPLTLRQLRAAQEGDTINPTIEATDRPSSHELTGYFLEPDESSPFNTFHRTDRRLTMRWSSETKFVMGTVENAVVGGVFRAHGTLRPQMVVDTSSIVVLSGVATIAGHVPTAAPIDPVVPDQTSL